MKNIVARAVELVGGPTRATVLTGFSAAQIYNWRDQGFVKDAAACCLLAEASGLPVQELAGLVRSGPDGRWIKSTATSCDGVISDSESDEPLNPLAGATACAA